MGGRALPQKCQHGVYVSGGDFLSDESCPKCDELNDRADEAYELGAAWQEAEAALPWKHSLGPSIYQDGKDGLWVAYAVERSLLRPMPVTIKGFATPAAALRALAAKLRER